MKKTLLSLAALAALASSLAFGGTSTTRAEDQPTQTNDSSVVKTDEKLTWTYPFAKNIKNGVNPMYNSQVFGNTDYARSVNPLSYFHDGWDFGWCEVGHSTVKAIHPSTVKQVAYGSGLGWYVWVVSPDKYVQIYQEGFNKKSDIAVKEGQTIKTGQKIGKLTGSHLHLGLTKTTKKYINKNGAPCNNWYKDNGTWLNPITTIEKNLNN